MDACGLKLAFAFSLISITLLRQNDVRVHTMSATYNYLVPTLVSRIFGSYGYEESRHGTQSTPGLHALSTVLLVSGLF